MYLLPILCRNRGVNLFKRVQFLGNESTGSLITSKVYCQINDKLKRVFSTSCPAKDQRKTFDEFDRTKFDILIKRRFIFNQSYEIYGGASGFFDLGPIGCALKTNILQFWRNFFVLEEQMLEIECPALTAESVFKASGHMQRFNDYLVKDAVTDETFRLDHLVRSHLVNLCSKTNDQTLESELKSSISKLDSCTIEEFSSLLKKYNIKSPTTRNALTEPIEYNLMFGTQLGPAAATKGYLRPETSQGIFVNFKHLLDYNGGRLPFAVAQIGNAFRNEISPRGLLRVREFALAEIEHFMDPIQSTHPKFGKIENHEITLYSGDDQMNSRSAIRMTIGDAVRSGLVKNETLGYYLARIQEFLIRIGISSSGLRFRQHMCNEMAHYAEDCWDAECLTSHGWIECVGCADRSDHDLGKHSLESGVNFSAKRIIAQPIEIEYFGISPTKEALNRFKNKQRKLIKKALSDLNMSHSNEAVLKLEKDGHFDLQIDVDEHIRLNKSEVKISSLKKTEQTEDILPCVIEPSFGIGRIMYALLEHSFRKRDGDDGNSYFALLPLVAPHKCAVLPLVSKPELQRFVEIISSNLKENEILHKVDDLSGSIGRRYIRCDEIGVPISITVDYDTLEKPHTVTLRDRDTKGQLRIPIEDVSQVVRALSNEKTNWKKLSNKYPSFGAQRSTN